VPLYVVALCYSSALVLALLLLWYFGGRRWYWHLLSFVTAFSVGLYPMPESWNTPELTLAVT
jgi:hypothetical protein